MIKKFKDAMQRWKIYSTTKRGKDVMQMITVAAAAGTGFIYLLPETYGLNYMMRRMYQLYFQGQPFPPTKDFLNLVSEVYDDMKVDVDEARLMRIYTVMGFEPVSNGSTKLLKGALIGMPKSIYYKTIDDINQNDIKLHMTENIPWQSIEGRALSSSLVLSDDAKRFAIAREVYMANNRKHVVKSLIATFMTLGYFALNMQLTARFKDRFTRRLQRYNLYAFNAVITIFIATIVMDMINCYYEKNADQKTAELGEKYLKGGCEFYAKQLQRNRVLRVLLKEQGMAFYSAEGDLNFMFRQPYVPITSRRDFFYKKLYGDDESAVKQALMAKTESDNLNAASTSASSATDDIMNVDAVNRK